MGGDHKCPVCQATFTRPQHVARHMRSRKFPIAPQNRSVDPTLNLIFLFQIPVTDRTSANTVEISLREGSFIYKSPSRVLVN